MKPIRLITTLLILAGSLSGTASAAPGHLQWQKQVSRPFYSMPALKGQEIYIGNNAGILYAYSTKGEELWHFKSGGYISSAPTLDAQGNIYFGSYDDHLYALNPQGKLLWKYKTDGPIAGSAALDAKGNLYFGSLDYNLYALTPKGKLLWKYKTGGRIASSPVISSTGDILFGSYDTHLYSLNARGSLNWRYKTQREISTSAALGKDTTYIGSEDGFLYALNTQSGEVLWKFNTGGPIWGDPIVGPQESVFVANSKGKLIALFQGEEAWRFETRSAFQAGPVLGEDYTLYIGSHKGKLYALSLTGANKWFYPAGGKITSPVALSETGQLIFAGGKNQLFSIESSSKGIANTPWPKSGQNSLNQSIQK